MNKTALISNLFEEYYNEMKGILEKSQDNVWDKLTEEQKKEVLLSYEESESQKNLLVNETVMKKYNNWL